jgi:histidinol phosphatase-like enzyme
MNRYKYIIENTQKSSSFIGLFPWGTVIDPAETNHKNSQIAFLEQGVEFLKELRARDISVVLFINQFRPYAVSYDDLKNFIESVEKFVREQGVTVMGTYWCPGIDKKDPFVVPNPGMFIRVTENIGVNWNKIPVLSAHDFDLSAAVKVKATPIKIGSEHNKHQSFLTLSDWIASI